MSSLAFEQLGASLNCLIHRGRRCRAGRVLQLHFLLFPTKSIENHRVTQPLGYLPRTYIGAKIVHDYYYYDYYYYYYYY